MCQTGRRKHRPAIQNTEIHSQQNVCVLVCVCVCVSYGTSRSVLLSSCPSSCMYLHWPSLTGRPVRWMLSSVSWASSNSHCTTNTGPGRETGRAAGHTSVVFASTSAGWRSTHFLRWGRRYIQRNTSTPLPDGPVCSSLAPNRPRTCKVAPLYTTCINLSTCTYPPPPPSPSPSVLPDASLYGLGGGTADGVQAVCELVLFVVQEPAGVGQAPDLHPPVALRVQLLCDVVHVHQDTRTARTGWQEVRSEGARERLSLGETHIYSGHNTHTVCWTDLLPARSRTLALSRPFVSSSFTTSLMIREPMNA